MKKLFLTGRSEAGKTSLTQALKGETLHYVKTQYTNTSEDTIDSPGEYAESKHFSAGLACFSFEADVVALVQAADEPFNLFGANCQSFILRPLIGIITKIDSPYNTYMYKGLPKGPIANPGKAAINAALYPETTEYLYFKVTSDGVTVFSKTLEEHNSK